jgi:hypothetical protein
MDEKGMHAVVWLESKTERDYWEYLNVGGSIILK